MTIGEIIRYKDIDTYIELIKMSRGKVDKPKKIELGDSIKNLMKANSYKKIGGAIRQTRWE